MGNTSESLIWHALAAHFFVKKRTNPGQLLDVQAAF
jgi:hypothetical protein